MKDDNLEHYVGYTETIELGRGAQFTIPPEQINDSYAQRRPALVTRWAESTTNGRRSWLRYRHDHEPVWSDDDWTTVVSGSSLKEAISHLREQWIKTYEYLAYCRQAPLSKSEQVVLMELEEILGPAESAFSRAEGKHVVIGASGAPIDVLYELSDYLDARLVEMYDRHGAPSGVQLFFEPENVSYTYVVSAASFGEAVSGLLRQLGDHRRLAPEDADRIEKGLAHELEQILVKSK